MTSIAKSLRERFALLRSRVYWNSRYDWSDQGDEWSAVWGGTGQLWWGTLYPRVHSYLPTSSVVEIAPGFGRCSQYLAALSERLVLVDIAQNCIDACQERFSGYDHIEYHVNDGKSLSMVADDPVDLVFSYDSLVHAPVDVLEAYVEQLPRLLKSDGVAFIHHSNLGSYPYAGKRPVHDDQNGRDTSTSADLVRQKATDVGLSCFTQELMRWGDDERYSDAISVMTPAGSSWDREPQVVENPTFMDDAAAQARLAGLYGVVRP